MLYYIVILLLISLCANSLFVINSVKNIFYHSHSNTPNNSSKINYSPSNNFISNYNYSPNSLLYNFILIFVYILNIAALVILSLFLKFHLVLVFENKTTIETIDKKNENFVSPYSLGGESNFKQVFGLNKVLWFIPFRDISGNPIGNGVDWDSNFELEDVDFINSSKKESKEDNLISNIAGNMDLHNEDINNTNSHIINEYRENGDLNKPDQSVRIIIRYINILIFI